jgi:dihydrofolate reductase
MEAIIAIDEEYGLAKDGKIPWKNKEDMKFFKDKTINNIVVMGSKTLETLPNQLPLKNRYNIVLTNNKNNLSEKYSSYDNIIFYNYEELINYIDSIDTDTDKTIYVIGGKQIYDLLIPMCSKIWLSVIPNDYNCDLKMYINFDDYDKKLVEGKETFNLYCLSKKGDNYLLYFVYFCLFLFIFIFFIVFICFFIFIFYLFIL